jgi:Alkaline and neutral invertase
LGKGQSKALDLEQAIAQAEELFWKQALVTCQNRTVGAVAAIQNHSPGDFHGDLNYGEVFIRDNVPVMVYLMIKGKTEVVRHFLDTSFSLQSTKTPTVGIFPTSFTERDGLVMADYGQRAIGRVASVDASLWIPILAHLYVQKTGDTEWAAQSKIQVGLTQLLTLLLRPRFHHAPTLYVPDAAFMIDRPLDVWGAPLEIQTLLYGALLCCAKLLKIGLAHKGIVNPPVDGNLPRHQIPRDPFTAQQVKHYVGAIACAKDLRRYLLRHYWVNSKSIQVLRQRPNEEYGDRAVNEYNIRTETIPHWLQDWLGKRGGYLLGNIRTGKPDFRFFTLGNCLGALFDVLSYNQQEALFYLIAQNQKDLVAQMPLRICHPPLDDEDWRRDTGYDPKNRPWSYHNGGHWPCLLWFLCAGALRLPQVYEGVDSEFQEVTRELLESSYKLLLEQLPAQRWAEYFDGPTGLWTGQQTRYYQTWTIVGFLLVHHLLDVDPTAARILDVPSLKDLCRSSST